MPRYSEYTEAPYQGVSQAPEQVRLSTQAAAIFDASVSIPSGAGQRPPLEFQGQLNGPTDVNMQSAYIPKGGVGNFLLTISEEAGVTTPKLFDMGDFPSDTPVSPVSVTISSAAQAYLDAGDPTPDADIELLTVEDYTFILNRKVEVALSGDTTDTRPYEAMLWVRQAAYARKYTITVRHGASMASTLVVTLETPNGKNEEDGEDVDTDVIAKALVDGIYPVSSTGASNGGAITAAELDDLIAAGFTVSRTGGVIYLSHDTYDFTVEVSDGQGGEALLAVKDKVQSFSDLPKKAPVDGFTVRLTQQTGTDQDDFFVRWEETAGAGSGIWAETVAPGSGTGLDPETLPVGLVYDQGAGTWSIDVLGWAERQAGDDELNPDPGFVGGVIQDITFWKGRLHLQYAEGARLSSAADPLTLYPTTLSQVLDDDAFEIVNPLTQQAQFRYAVPFKKKLIMWGATAQAQVQAPDGALTSDNVGVDPYSYYEFAEEVRPQGSNDRLYFAAKRGLASSAIFEQEISTVSASGEAEGDDMSVHVPRYIPTGLNRAATCPVNYLTIWGRSGDSEATVHYYRYSDRERVQNAWLRWRLPEGCTYAGGFFVNTRLHMLVQRGGVIHLLIGDTADGLTDSGSSVLTTLNYKVGEGLISKAYSAGTDQTTITLPYKPQTEPLVVVTAPGGEGGPSFGGELLDAPEGTQAEVVSWSNSSFDVIVSGDWTSAPLIVGELFEGYIKLSRIYYRDPQGKPNRTGQLVLRKITFDLDRTAYLQCRVTVGNRPARTYTFEASRYDSPGADFDQINLYSGPWSVPIGGNSEDTEIELLMGNHLPAFVLGWTWEGEVNPKAGRVS